MAYINGSNDFMIALKGDKGDKGDSAYDIACAHGFMDTEEKWLESLKGKDGANGTNGTNGKSAYNYAKDCGYTGTESEFATALARIIAMPIYDGDTEDVDMIVFTIQTNVTKDYFATNGMTWDEWIFSEFNTDGYYFDGEGIVRTENTEEVQFSGEAVHKADVIVAGRQYEYAGG